MLHPFRRWSLLLSGIISSAAAIAVNRPSNVTDPCDGTARCLHTTSRHVANLVLQLDKASLLQHVRQPPSAAATTETPTTRKNLCMGGRIAPELVLYGPARASTTTFGRNFVTSPQVVFGRCSDRKSKSAPICPPEGWKEMHFYVDWDGKNESKQRYLDHYPPCTQAKRIVAADLTPGQHIPSTGILDKIAQFYGAKSPSVSFVMLLRDPVKCMQSFYHFEEQEKEQPFEGYVRNLLSKGNTGHYRYLNNVVYADALQQFLDSKVFKPWQLTIIPMQYNEAQKNGHKRASDAFWDVMGVAKGDPKRKVERANYNDNHVSVEQDLPPAVYKKLGLMLEEMAGAHVLGNIIAKAWQAGAGPLLYGYRGSETNATNIAAWLKNGW